MKIVPNKTKVKWEVVEDFSSYIKCYVMAPSREEAERIYLKKGVYGKPFTRQLLNNLIVEGVELEEV